MFAHPENQPAGRGRLLEETVRLLADLPIAPDAGRSREGDRMSVRATAESVDATVRLRVTCYTHGHLLTDWERIRLAVAPAAQPDQLRFLPTLDARGQTQASLPPHAGYLLSAFHRLPSRFHLAGTQSGQVLEQHQVLVLDQSLGGPVQTRAATRTVASGTLPPDPTLLPLDQPRRFDLGNGMALLLIPSEQGCNIQIEPPASAHAGARMELVLTGIDAATGDETLRERTTFVMTPDADRLAWSPAPHAVQAGDAFTLLWRLIPTVAEGPRPRATDDGA